MPRFDPDPVDTLQLQDYEFGYEVDFDALLDTVQSEVDRVTGRYEFPWLGAGGQVLGTIVRRAGHFTYYDLADNVVCKVDVAA